MASLEHDSEAIEDLARIPKPGQLIKKAREQRQLSRAELSQRTRLTESALISVEADDYPALGQPVYARGYYRKCAEALGLNGEMLVDAYEKRSGTGSPIPVIQQRPSIRYKEGPGLWPLVAVALLAGGVIGVSAWLLMGQNPGALSAWLKSLSAVSADAGPAPAATPQPSPGALIERRRAVAPAAEPAVEQDDDGRGSDVSRERGSADALENSRLTSLPQQRRPAATPAPTAEPQFAAAAVPRLRIVMQAGESWTEVSDRTGEQLIYKLLPQGAEREVKGQPPYEVYLGRADLVRIWLDDELVDISAVIQPDLRAKFRILGNGKVEG